MLVLNKEIETTVGMMVGDVNHSLEPASVNMRGNVSNVVLECLRSPFLALESLFNGVNVGKLVDGIKNPNLQNVLHRSVQVMPNYMVMSKTSVSTPAGLTTDILTYLETVDSISTCIFNELPKNLNELSRKVGTLINDPDQASRLMDGFNNGFSDPDVLVKQLSKVYDPELKVAKRPYRKAVKRNNDWEAIGTLTDKLINLMRTQNVREIEEKISRTAHSCEVLLNDKLPDGKASTATVTNLGKSVYQLGKLCQVYSVMVSIILELDTLKTLWEAEIGKFK